MELTRTDNNYAATERTYKITFDLNWQRSNLKVVGQEMNDIFENGSAAAEIGCSKCPYCHGSSRELSEQPGISNNQYQFQFEH